MDNSLLCMIPVRKGSNRVKGKALREVAGKSLLAQSIELALTRFSPELIYLNTNWDELKEVSDYYGINFYRRSESLCSATSTNDEFVYDFLTNISCLRLIQLLPTSPFVLSAEFASFCSTANLLSFESLVSVGSHRIACVLEDGKPLNFSRSKMNPPSQTMAAIYSYVGVLMSWHSESFLDRFKRQGCAYHGDTNNHYFPLSFLSQLDIDTEDDLLMAQKLSNLLPIH